MSDKNYSCAALLVEKGEGFQYNSNNEYRIHGGKGGGADLQPT